MTLVSSWGYPSTGVWAAWRRTNFVATGNVIAEIIDGARRKKKQQRKTRKRRKKQLNWFHWLNDHYPADNHATLLKTVRRANRITSDEATVRANRHHLFELTKRFAAPLPQQIHLGQRHRRAETPIPPPPESLSFDVERELAAMSLSPKTPETKTTTTMLTTAPPFPENDVRVTWIRAPSLSGTCCNDVKTNENAPPPPPPPPPTPPPPSLLPPRKTT